MFNLIDLESFNWPVAPDKPEYTLTLTRNLDHSVVYLTIVTPCKVELVQTDV